MFVYSPFLAGNSFRHRCTMPPPSRREALRPPPRGGCRHRRLGEFLPDSQKENSSSKRAGPRGSGSLRFAVIRKKPLLDAALLAVFTHALETDGYRPPEQNRSSSLPLPTFSPGMIWVPRADEPGCCRPERTDRLHAWRPDAVLRNRGCSWCAYALLCAIVIYLLSR